MSFWFAKRARKRPAKAAGALAKAKGPSAPIAKQNALVLNRIGCKACPLDKAEICTPKMAPTLAPHTDVYILAEAPGGHEDEQSGRPLTGPGGKLLRSCLEHRTERTTSFDNVINCRPPGNRTPVYAEIECCRPRRIKNIEEAKPKIILGLGPIPMQALLGTTDMAGLRGRLFAVKIGNHRCWFLPTYDPAFIMRLAYDKQKPLNSRLGHCFRMDVNKAFNLAKRLAPPEIVTEAELKAAISVFSGHEKADFPQTLLRLERAQTAPIKSVDLETRFLRPYTAGAAIMTVAISHGDENFSFALNHPKAGWTQDQRKTLISRLKSLLRDNTVKVAHNAPFEIEWLISLCGRDVVNHGAWECTMMQAHFLDERKGKYREDDSGANRYQGLDFLIGQHFGIKYKHLFKLNKKDMAKADLHDTMVYNAVDTKYTLKLYYRQRQLLKEEGLTDAYIESVFKQPTVALMQSFGVPVDQKAVKKAQNKLTPEIKKLEAELHDLKVVKAFTKDKHAFNWASGPDCIAIFKDYLKRREIHLENGKVSVDKNVLEQIDHPLANLIVTLRNRSKLKSTYIDGLELGVGTTIYPDGQLHTSFNTTATETGRLSSDGPNLQNYPKRQDAWVRSLIAAPPGHVLLAVDYGQLEACTGAMCSRDKYLTQALWEDYDIHMEWAKKFADAEPALVDDKADDPGVMKKFRSLIKNKMVFPAFFGAANESVRGYLHSATGFDIDQGIVDDLMDEFWSSFNGMANWQKRTMKRYYDEGYVVTMQGRKHRYPLSKNQAVNMPIQGTAAELVCDAMNRLSYMALSSGQLHLHPLLNIHDDLTFILPDDDKIIEDAINTISREMLVFDFPWINVPLSVEISLGSNWANVQSVAKLWSHKEHNFPRG